MDPDPRPPGKKSPWELYLLAAIMVAVMTRGAARGLDGDPFAYVVVAALGLCLVGLLLRLSIAWWATLVSSAASAVIMIVELAENYRQYGFRFHRTFVPMQVGAAVALACAGLLLGCKLRRAYVPRRLVADEAPKGNLDQLAREPVAARLGRSRLNSVAGLLAVLLTLVFALAAFVSLGVVAFVATHRYHGERSLSYKLKTLAAAEADFRSNDRDGNHVNDFWTGDVRGLYAIVPRDGTERIKLIDLSAALADSDPLQGRYPPLAEAPSPANAAWIWALSEDRSVTPPQPYRTGEGRDRNTGAFGFIVYPDDYIIGPRQAFIINEGNTIYRRPLRGDLRPSGERVPPGPLTAPGFVDWPSDEELKASWSKLD